MRSCFIDWPTMPEALIGIGALHAMRAGLVPFVVQGIHVVGPEDDEGPYASVFFGLDLDDLTDDGHALEQAFIAAGRGLRGIYTGS